MNTFLTEKFSDKILKKISNKVNDWNCEVTVKDCQICSRIDFKVKDVYIEVKNVPLASYSLKKFKKYN